MVEVQTLCEVHRRLLEGLRPTTLPPSVYYKGFSQLLVATVVRNANRTGIELTPDRWERLSPLCCYVLGIPEVEESLINKFVTEVLTTPFLIGDFPQGC